MIRPLNTLLRTQFRMNSKGYGGRSRSPITPRLPEAMPWSFQTGRSVRPRCHGIPRHRCLLLDVAQVYRNAPIVPQGNLSVRGRAMNYGKFSKHQYTLTVAVRQVTPKIRSIRRPGHLPSGLVQRHASERADLSDRGPAAGWGSVRVYHGCACRALSKDLARWVCDY